MTERLGNVLVATDFSRPGAVDRAALLPMTAGATFTLLHVLPSDLPAASAQSWRGGAERRLSEQVEHARAMLGAAGQSEVRVVGEIAGGKPVAAICEQARLARAELVVVGRGGGQRAARRIGANAERVARASDVSVLVVGCPPQGCYRKPLVAVDGGDLTSAVVELAVRVLAPEVRRLELVHVFQIPAADWVRDGEMNEQRISDDLDQFGGRARQQIEQLLSTLPSRGVAYELLVLEGDPRWVLLEQAEDRQSDLLVVGTRGHSRLLRLLMGSVAESIMREATIDVLVVR